MNNMWLEVACTVPEDAVETFGDFLVELSGNGISIENLSVDTFSLESIPLSSVKTIKAYFPADTPPESITTAIAAFVEQRKASFPDLVIPTPAISVLKSEDWANNWKEYFKPSRIGQHLVIKPTWESFDGAPDDVIIEVDPGQAFGTGTHATTRLCLESIEKLFLCSTDSTCGMEPASILDVGTGSGVLCIAAAKLGARHLTAVDIDPDAVEVARENFAVNHVSGDITISTTPLSDITGTYDVVVANIIAEELVRLASELVNRVQPGGYLILSGILTEREAYVESGFSPFPLRHMETTHREEWSCLTYRREG